MHTGRERAREREKEGGREGEREREGGRERTWLKPERVVQLYLLRASETSQN